MQSVPCSISSEHRNSSKKQKTKNKRQKSKTKTHNSLRDLTISTEQTRRFDKAFGIARHANPACHHRDPPNNGGCPRLSHPKATFEDTHQNTCHHTALQYSINSDSDAVVGYKACCTHHSCFAVGAQCSTSAAGRTGTHELKQTCYISLSTTCTAEYDTTVT